VEIERALIPPYITAAWTQGPAAAQSNQIFRIAKQEMLHLCLAGNLLKAYGGEVVLFDRDVMAPYPKRLAGEQILAEKVHLRHCSPHQLDAFVEFEKPKNRDASGVPQDWVTIGEFYQAISTLIVQCSPHIDANSVQFLAFNFGGRVQRITDQNTALAAINLIVEQGEGHVEREPPTITTDDPKELNHYFQFTVIRDDPDQAYFRGAIKMIPDPRTGNLPEGNAAKTLSQLFNAVYSLMLANLQRVFHEGDTSVAKDNFWNLMKHALRPAGMRLLQEPAGLAESLKAGPSWEYSTATPAEAIALATAVDPTGLAEVINTLKNLK